MITLHRTRSTASGEPLAKDLIILRSRLDNACHICCTFFHNCIKDSFHMSVRPDNVSDCESLFYINSQNRASLFSTRIVSVQDTFGGTAEGGAFRGNDVNPA